ncbi:MAG: PAS domain-containing sensor histidine kinase, partial [Ramlibacter sp.]
MAELSALSYTVELAHPVRLSSCATPAFKKNDVNSNDIQRLLRATPGLLLALRPDAGFTIVAASEGYLRATDQDASIFGRPLFEVFPDHPAELRDSLRRVISSGAVDSMPAQRHVNAPVLTPDGQVEYILHCVEDASHRTHRDDLRLAELELLILESERQRRIYETALDSTPDFVYVFDLDHRALYANDALVKTWGVGDVRGKKWMELGYEQWHADLHDAEIDRVIATRAPIRGEIPFTGTNGRRIYDYIFAPVLDPGGEVVAVAGTTRDITDRQAAEQAIRDQAERLAESDRTKDEFLATLSHELRNPLAPLRNAIALLKAGGASAKSMPVLDMMGRQINHLVRLVDDLLEVSRISRGTFSLRTERVDLASVVRNAVEANTPLIQAGRHSLDVHLPAEPLWLEGDPVRLAQILSNLLNNAATYAEDGGRITVRARREDGQAVISVLDGGVGMEPASVQRMFEMFSRGERDSARSQGGLGIGLALSRRLAQMHNGTLDAHSAGPGKGSEFTMRIPLAAGAQAEAEPATAANPLSNTRVLVVDDNHDAGDSLAMILEML